MLKKILKSLTLCAGLLSMTTVPVVAHADVATVLHAGYCNGIATDSENVIVNDAEQVSACVYLNDSVASRYHGNRMTAIDFNLVSKLSVSELTVWVRTSLDGENLAAKTYQRSELAKGWNRLVLDVPVELTAGGYYVGYTFTQSRSALVIATSGRSYADGLYLKADNGAWQQTGMVLALECEIEGDQLPQRDARIEQISLSKDSLKAGQPLGVNCMVTNVACQPLTSLQLTCTAADMQPMTFTTQLDSAVNYRDTCYVNFTFTPASKQLNQALWLNVTIDQVNGVADEEVGDGLTAHYTLLSNDYRRNCVIEAFTSEYCVWCPNGASILAEAIEMVDGGKHVVPISHHCSNYHADPFTNKAADDTISNYFWVSANPQYMYNRTGFDGTFMFTPSKAQEHVDVINYICSTAADIEVNASATVDHKAHTITVHVNGETADGFDATDPHITLYLLEDNVLAVAQMRGYEGVVEGYRHQHLLRDFNASWGEPLQLTDGSYSYEYTFTYDPAVNDYNNLKVAALVTEHGADVNHRQVLNADKIEMKYVGVRLSEGADGLPGDVDGDGAISISDVNALIDLVLNGEDVSADMMSRADVNQDGALSVSDVNALIDLVMK